MNLRNVGKYNVGIDLGTGSVGWAVTDEDGNLLHFKGRPTWGSRIFSSAETAAAARGPRGQRRRYIRRRQRLNLLQELFQDEMNSTDPEFFVRLNQSRLLKEDRDPSCSDYRWPLFNSSDFTEVQYYEKFPTIYHLRKWLMETDEKVDIRLIYLAFHNMVKTRGNFLHQDDPNLSAKSANMDSSVERFCNELAEWCKSLDVKCACEESQEEIAAILEDSNIKKAAKRDSISGLLGFAPSDKKLAKAIAQAITGYVADFSIIFSLDSESAKFSLGNDERVEEFASVCPDEATPLFDAMKAVYSALILAGILKNAEGGTLSTCKVKEYEQYGEDLKLLKDLVKKYVPGQYDEFFRGDFYEGTKIYDVSKAKGYTKYNSARATSYEDFKKEIMSLFKGTSAEEDKVYKEMMSRFEDETFLRRLKTSDNGSIPYQLHLEEMDAIIEKQGVHYPFLLEDKKKLESLITFRIPYYVGPLTTKNAPVDSHGNMRFAWSKRLPGKEGQCIKPWNWDEIIDKHGSAQAFIERMTGECTYLEGEPVLPKCSLLYEEFCVLNELNGAHFTEDGDKEHRFNYADRIGIIDDLFKRRRGKIKYKDVEEWMERERGIRAKVSGGQGENCFESRLISYGFFCDKVFHTDEISETNIPMVEEIIHWNTLFEDRSILKEELERKYGDKLDDDQIKAICKKRFTGWGRLSRKLLMGLKSKTDDGPMSVMDVLREGNPSSGKRSHQSMVLMEILRDDDLGFAQLIEDENKAYFEVEGDFDINALPGSPAIRRSINQAVRIVEEIASIAGHAPANVFIEVTREDDFSKRGKRTKKRYDDLSEALAAFREHNSDWWDSNIEKELRARKDSSLSERLTLYFMQGGKSLYSGKELDIDRLSDYHVDHILPQSYIKDDSFENKALVLPSENEAKSDNMLIDSSIRRKMRGYWKALHDAGLIGKKKYSNLMRSNLSEDKLKGFIARQLVETSQSVKLLQMQLTNRYPETNVMPIKASLSSTLRDVEGYVKCREINDYHHAHDALLACEVGRFILFRFPDMQAQPVKYAATMKEFARVQGNAERKYGRRYGSAGFIIGSFRTSGFDKETGELFRDEWDAEFETDRIRRYLNYKDCFITKMPEITSGALWDATIYSPRDPKKQNSLKLPLKIGLDPKRYGSYSREQFAYFFVYEGMKKGKKVYEFAPVPVSIAAQMGNSEGALEEYAKLKAEESGIEYVKVARPRICKQQVVEIGGNRFLITGLSEVRNGIQPAFSLSQSAEINAIFNEEEIEQCRRMDIYEDISHFIKQKCSKLAHAIKIESIDEQFEFLSEEQQSFVIKELIAVSTAKKNRIDLTCVGGSKYSGALSVNYSKDLCQGEDSIIFIDQSVTGMFERRSRIGV